MIYATIVKRIVVTTTDIKLQICPGVVPEQLRTPYVDFGKVLRNAYGALTYLQIKLLVPLMEQHRIASYSVPVIFQIAEFETSCSRNTYPVYLSMPHGAFPETFPKNLKISATDTIRRTYKLSLIF